MKDKQTKIDILKARIKELIQDENWSVTECFLMSMDGRTSPEIISIHRKGLKEALLAIPTKERQVVFRKQWYQDSYAIASNFATILRQNGFKVTQDISDLYIKL